MTEPLSNRPSAKPANDMDLYAALIGQAPVLDPRAPSIRSSRPTSRIPLRPTDATGRWERLTVRLTRWCEQSADRLERWLERQFLQRVVLRRRSRFQRAVRDSGKIRAAA